MPPILFATETAVSRAPQLNNQLLVNAFVERQGPTAKSQAPIFGAPGLTATSLLSGPTVRGSHNFNEVAYYVSGPNLYSVAADNSFSLVATGIAGTGPVSIDDNGTQVAIVNGAQGYIYTVAGGLVQITAAAFYPAETVTFMDGYFIFDRVGTNEFFLSALYDGTSFNGLDFASAEGQSGFVVATVQNLQLLFIFTTSHIELWYDAGASDFPFQRYAGGIINYGTISPRTIIKQDGAIFFLGRDHTFYRLQANIPIRVSTHEIETLIALDPDITRAECLTFTLEGHKMVVLNLVASSQTVAFDISTGKWHSRRSWQQNPDGSLTDLGRWRAAVALEIYDTVFIGDAFSGQIGQTDWYNAFTEFGNPMPMIARSAPQHHDRMRVFVDRFELDIQAGVGLISGQGSDPQVMLRYSRDGGETWSLQQQWRSMGKQGQYTKRLRWLKQGQGREWQWEVTITDPVWRTIIAAHADLAVGA